MNSLSNTTRGSNPAEIKTTDLAIAFTSKVPIIGIDTNQGKYGIGVNLI